MSNKLMILESNRKKGGVLSFGGKRSCLKKNQGLTHREGGGGSSHYFAEK